MIIWKKLKSLDSAQVFLEGPCCESGISWFGTFGIFSISKWKIGLPESILPVAFLISSYSLFPSCACILLEFSKVSRVCDFFMKDWLFFCIHAFQYFTKCVCVCIYIPHKHREKKKNSFVGESCWHLLIKKKLEYMAVQWTELIKMFIWLIWASVTLLWHGIGKVNRLEVRQSFSNSIFCELQEASGEIHL